MLQGFEQGLESFYIQKEHKGPKKGRVRQESVDRRKGLFVLGLGFRSSQVVRAGAWQETNSWELVSEQGVGGRIGLASTIMAAVRRETLAPRLTVEMSVAMDWGRKVLETSMGKCV